jgi:hypothetical protein
MLVTTVGEVASSDKNVQRWNDETWNTGAPNDPIASSVANAVRQIEVLCRPHLTEGT